jgi:hypothetical protein
MVLEDRWLTKDDRGVRGGVELGFLSTTTKREVALEYSGADKDRGTVFEIDIGAVDCGAKLDSLSQYPGTCLCPRINGDRLLRDNLQAEAMRVRLEIG